MILDKIISKTKTNKIISEHYIIKNTTKELLITSACFEIATCLPAGTAPRRNIRVLAITKGGDFEILTQINVTPIDILLSMKILAILKRKREMSRDFYDVIFLSGKTKPNYNYLKEKAAINNVKQLKIILLEKSQELDFNALANDLQPFLFNTDDAKKLLLFTTLIDSLS